MDISSDKQKKWDELDIPWRGNQMEETECLFITADNKHIRSSYVKAQIDNP